MKPRIATRVSIPIFLAVVLLIGCASNSELATSAKTVPPVTVESASTLPLPSPAATVVELTPVTTPTLTPAQTAMPISYHYGVTYPDPKIAWSEADRLGVREHLEYLQELGVNTIVQSFSSRLIGTEREKDWLIFLDEAERTNMHVIVRLWPPIEWNGQEFDFQAIQSFLAVVQDHPALLAYLGLHEPLEQFNGDQLRSFYTGVKDLTPELAIAHYMGDMAWFEKSPRFLNRDFTAGICDICIVWYYPFRYLDGQPAFEEDLVRGTLQANRKLVDERAPDAQLWFLGQVYTLHTHKRQLRMPTPEEMEKLYTIAEQEQVDGFLWYPWLHGNCDQVLSDPEMEPQRQAVRHIYENYILQEPTP